MRRSISWLAAAVVFASALPMPAQAAGLTDMTGHWARAQVESGVAAGYVAGYPDGTFRPDAPITRAEFFKLLGGAMHLDPTHTPTDFQEERAGQPHWAFAQGYVPAAVAGGLLYPPDYANVLSPDTPISRREIVMAAVRALGQSAQTAQQAANLHTPDAGAYPDWLKGFAAAALDDGIIRGYEDGSLGLSRTATRAEALVMVQRILDKVTVSLSPENAVTDPTAVRHPAEGEPTWSWSAATPNRPAITNGTHDQDYTFATDVTGLTLQPAPGKALWLGYTEGADGVVARLSKGKLTEVARYPGARPGLLAVGDDGRLWFTDGSGSLQVAGADAQPVKVSGVSEQLQSGSIDWNGDFWGVGDAKVYRITSDLTVTSYDLEMRPDQHVEASVLADDGSLWLILQGAPGGTKAEAVQLQYGKVVQRMDLLNRYFGGPGAPVGLQVVGRSGPFLWTEARVQDSGPAYDGSAPAHDAGLYRLNLATAEFSRVVLPRTGPAAFTVQQAADGGALLRDDAGKFWRLVP